MLIRDCVSTIESVFRANWDYPFESSLELFKQIVREDIEGEFSCYLLKNYQYHAKELDELDQLKYKECREKLNSDEEQKKWELIDKHTAKAIWFDRLIRVTNVLAKQGVVDFQRHLYIHGEIIKKMSELRMKRYRDPKLKAHKRPSHYCLDGRHYLGVNRWRLT